MNYVKRITSPLDSDKNYYHYTSGGYNYCIKVYDNSCLPNCVGYAWGRWRELLNKYHNLSRANAEDWWNTNDGYLRGSTPKIGAIICWQKGELGNGNDGAGHVGVVEEINSDGSILISNSAYKSTKFFLLTLKAPYNVWTNYQFQGFIYNPENYENDVNPSKSIDEIANEVINGLWKNNPERKTLLLNAGYDYDSVQKRVNELLSDSDKLSIGDDVKIIDSGNASSYGGSKTANAIGYKRKILNIFENREYPYQVGNEFGTTGFYKKNALEKI